MRALITVSAGKIGHVLVAGLKDPYQLRGLHLNPTPGLAAALVADLADLSPVLGSIVAMQCVTTPADQLARAQVEADPVDRVDGAVLGVEDGLQPLDLEDRRCRPVEGWLADGWRVHAPVFPMVALVERPYDTDLARARNNKFVIFDAK